MKKEAKGELGVYRRSSGVFMIIVCGIMSLLHGFKFYEANSDIIWATGIIGLCLLISGIAKDVVSIIKAKVSK